MTLRRHAKNFLHLKMEVPNSDPVLMIFISISLSIYIYLQLLISQSLLISSELGA